MSQPRGRGSNASKRVGATRGETHEQSPAIQAEGRWAGDVRAFVDWCEGTSDLDAYRAALATVPPHDAWKAVSRTLHADPERRQGVRRIRRQQRLRDAGSHRGRPTRPPECENAAGPKLSHEQGRAFPSRHRAPPLDLRSAERRASRADHPCQ